MPGSTLASSLPQHLDLLHDTETIETMVATMAAEVEQWARDCLEQDGRMLLMMCVLRGGVFFYSDLLQSIGYSVEPAFCRGWSYAKDVNARPEDAVRIDWPEIDVRGRHVVLVDNICDTGRTFAHAVNELNDREPASVRTVSLIRRKQKKVVHEPTLSGVSYLGNEWLVGYGLRDRGTTMMNARVVAKVRASESTGFTMNNASSPFEGALRY